MIDQKYKWKRSLTWIKSLHEFGPNLVQKSVITRVFKHLNKICERYEIYKRYFEDKHKWQIPFIGNDCGMVSLLRVYDNFCSILGLAWYLIQTRSFIWSECDSQEIDPVYIIVHCRSEILWNKYKSSLKRHWVSSQLEDKCDSSFSSRATNKTAY